MKPRPDRNHAVVFEALTLGDHLPAELFTDSRDLPVAAPVAPGNLSAWDVLQRGYGVCRDFAPLAVALNRAFNLPARYVTGLTLAATGHGFSRSRPSSRGGARYRRASSSGVASS